MLEFKKTQKDEVEIFKPWFEKQTTHISDYSIAFQYMWHKYLAPDYAFFGDCLILKETYLGKEYFYYPLSLSGTEEEKAIAEIERYCRENCIRLHFTNVPRRAVAELTCRYGREVLVTNNRRWRDYLYRVEDFKTYAGGKYAGQRNHVNKFKKLYPSWQFRICSQADMPEIVAVLREYEISQRGKHAYLADAEMNEVYAVLPEMERFGMVYGLLEVDGKPIGFSAGELCGDMLVVHIEKALRGYEGAYPMLAQQFALTFCKEGCNFLNRMDDAADPGLRKSKLQYLPCEIVDKYNIIPKRAIDLVSRMPVIRSERLTLAPVKDADAEQYARLASNVERNRYWGYDWRQDRQEETPPPITYFLTCAREDFKHKHEMPLGIYYNKMLVGEVVLHAFGYADEAEIGVRLLPEAEGNGFAREAVRAYANYAFLTLSLSVIEAKCFKENARSRAALLGAGMRPCGEDETYYRFRLTPAM